jgi:hypothetical protein
MYLKQKQESTLVVASNNKFTALADESDDEVKQNEDNTKILDDDATVPSKPDAIMNIVIPTENDMIAINPNLSASTSNKSALHAAVISSNNDGFDIARSKKKLSVPSSNHSNSQEQESMDPSSRMPWNKIGLRERAYDQKLNQEEYSNRFAAM